MLFSLVMLLVSCLSRQPPYIDIEAAGIKKQPQVWLLRTSNKALYPATYACGCNFRYNDSAQNVRLLFVTDSQLFHLITIYGGKESMLTYGNIYDTLTAKNRGQKSAKMY